MKIAIPTAQGRLCAHFGHCEQFALMDVNPDTKAVSDPVMKTPPPHEPGLLPRWIAEQGVTMVIAGGMGKKAIDIFAQNGVQVLVGAPDGEPRQLAESWLSGSLLPGSNVCDH